ncbi:flagellar M-ring protein FliF [Desulfuromonas thiophila]|uniref:Flagellar M-ring protein n=2 Tax=Desulfuromonas thiophila TaxID=57664 RepID=A0A1G7BMT0_9BACT|nr:flagellar M-ring protein FliF [Desulfuromonas thiophila]
MAVDLKGSLLAAMRNWPLSRKISLAAVALFSLSLFAIIILQSRQTEHELLFANLAPDDASAIVAWLKDRKIPYELHGSGNTIYIPAELVHETRLELTGAGLPQGGGVGFEIFDSQSLGITDFVQQVNYLRALQGELARTIAALSPVEAARVHLALPQKRLFKSQQQPATASIIVRLVAGQQLKESQVQGIVNLVAGSVEGLEPAYVTVVDTAGKVLSKKPEEGLGGPMTPGMLEYQQAVERQLETRAQAMLDRALGPANSLVKVTATLDFSQVEKLEEHYDPKSAVPRSEQMQEQKAADAGGAGGVPGVESNLGTGAANLVGGAGGNSSSSAETTNYEISKVVNRIVAPVGTIKQLSVSVLVADTAASDETSSELRFEPRNEQELRGIERMVQSALGIDNGRGDQLTVVSMPFANDFYSQPSLPEPDWSDRLLDFAPALKYVGLALAGLLTYLLLLRPTLRTLQQESTVQHMKTVKELEEELAAGRSRTTQLNPTEQMRQNILKGEHSPAQVIRTWLSEEK